MAITPPRRQKRRKLLVPPLRVIFARIYLFARSETGIFFLSPYHTETIMVNAVEFICIGAMSGVYVIAEKVCNQGKMKTGFFGPEPKPGCQRNMTSALCSSMSMVAAASCVLMPVSPPLATGLSILCVLLMAVSTTIGLSNRH